MSQVVLPSFASLGAGDIVALKLQNAGAATLRGGVTTFGQVFEQGDLPKGAGLVAEIGGKTIAVQVDVKTTYPDGSAKMVVLSLERPDLAAGTSLDVVLSQGAVSSAPAIDLAQAIESHSFKVDMTPQGGATTTIDVLAALKTALANGTASFWQKGEFATEARVTIDLPGSQRMVFDVTAYKGGGLSVDAQFNNDDAMQATGGRANYTLKAQLDGVVVANETVSQAQYQNWHETFTAGTSGGQGLGSASSGWLNIQHDTAYLEATGAVAKYNLATGVSDSQMNSYGNAIKDASWGDPLSSNAVTKYMPQTGGRPDIGITTEANTAWLMTQDIRAAEYALGQAEAAGAAPIHFWDAAHGVWLNTDNYPNLWLDGRGGVGRPGDSTSGTLVQGVDNSTGWTYDTAHQPDLSFVPYLMTGERWILDNINAQASASIMAEWPSPRQGSADLVTNGSQVRSIAWSLRQVDEAAWVAPEGSADKAFFTAASEGNWKFLVSKIPEWTAMQGEAYGWVPGSYGVAGALPPWQQDYFASTAIAAASRGNADALTFLKWEMNFLIGRFTHEASGFKEHDGAAYLVAISNPTTGAIYKTWAEIGAQTVARGWSNGDGWSKMDGDYGQLALATLSGIYQLTGDTGALAAYQALVADGIRFTDAATFANDPTFNLTLPVASVTAPDSATKPATPSTPTSTTIGSGSDTLVVKISEDAYNGHAQYTIKVDGVQVGGTLTASASHALGQSDTVTIKGNWGSAVHKVEVSFLNDAYGGSASTDRNLYVDGITYDGVAVPSSTVSIKNTGSTTFSTPALTPSSTDTLVLKISEDAYNGHAQYTIKVDGVQVGGTRTASASHALGQSDTVTLTGNWGSTPHKVEVSFLNDAWGGTSSTDRNLYVDSITYDGQAVPSSTVAIKTTTSATFLTPNIVAAGDSGGNQINGTAGADVLQGMGGGDTLSGLGGNDTLMGGDGNDTLSGGDGNDSLDGGAGADKMTGGIGDDIFVVDSLSDVVTELAGAGNDRVIASVSGYTLAANVERLDLAGTALTGNGNELANALYGNALDNTLKGMGGNDQLFGLAGHDTLLGGDGLDTLDGGEGNDLLDGGTGADKMTGGNGDDVYNVDNLGDVVVELAGGGNDRVVASVSGYVLVANVERLDLTGTALTATGNEAANVIVGNALDNLLKGMGGDDQIFGNAGKDTLEGGTGNDTLYGGDGNDSIDSGTGNDLMIGGNGDDIFLVDSLNDIVVELAGGGNDRVTASVSGYLLAENVERLDLAGTALKGSGNELANQVYGNSLDNVLSGLGGNDLIYGGAGKDTLVGGLGADTLEGGAGADSFRYGSAAEGGDRITDFLAGTDFIEASVSGFGGGLTLSTSVAGRFVANTTGLATSAAGTGQFIYETDVAKLLWDADGAGGSAAVTIATFGSGTVLHASDIHLIG